MISMQIFNPFEQLFNELLLYTMFGEVVWESERVNDDIFYETEWLDHIYKFANGDGFINVYGQDDRRFTVFITDYQMNQLVHVISNKNFDWNKLPRRL